MKIIKAYKNYLNLQKKFKLYEDSYLTNGIKLKFLTNKVNSAKNKLEKLIGDKCNDNELALILSKELNTLDEQKVKDFIDFYLSSIDYDRHYIYCFGFFDEENFNDDLEALYNLKKSCKKSENLMFYKQIMKKAHSNDPIYYNEETFFGLMHDAFNVEWQTYNGYKKQFEKLSYLEIFYNALNKENKQIFNNYVQDISKEYSKFIFLFLITKNNGAKYNLNDCNVQLTLYERLLLFYNIKNYNNGSEIKDSNDFITKLKFNKDFLFGKFNYNEEYNVDIICELLFGLRLRELNECYQNGITVPRLDMSKNLLKDLQNIDAIKDVITYWRLNKSFNILKNLKNSNEELELNN